MAATYVTVTNRTATNLSLVGDNGSPRVDIPATSGSNYVTINISDLLGNSLLCTTLASWITAAKVEITRGSTTLTAADLTAWAQGADMNRSDYDANDDKYVDAAAAVTDGTTTWTAATVTGASVQLASLDIGFADLTAAALTQTINFAAALPASAVIIGAYIDVTAAFTDGAAGTFTVDVGVAGSDVILNGADVTTATGKIATPAGSAPTGWYGASTLTAKVIGSVNVDTATTGAMSVKIAYIAVDDALA